MTRHVPCGGRTGCPLYSVPSIVCGAPDGVLSDTQWAEDPLLPRDHTLSILPRRMPALRSSSIPATLSFPSSLREPVTGRAPPHLRSAQLQHLAGTRSAHLSGTCRRAAGWAGPATFEYKQGGGAGSQLKLETRWAEAGAKKGAGLCV